MSYHLAGEVSCMPTKQKCAFDSIGAANAVFTDRRQQKTVQCDFRTARTGRPRRGQRRRFRVRGGDVVNNCIRPDIVGPDVARRSWARPTDFHSQKGHILA